MYYTGDRSGLSLQRLESPHTGERHAFGSLEQLFAYLSDKCDRQLPYTPEAPGI
jgi:hypothetical protein